ncbi:hypothetical protein JYP51_09365 [Ponticoccus gilvus]|nr:hypothetical protein [Enemella evansiae]
MTATLLKITGTFGATQFGKLSRDPVLDGAKGGALFGFDVSFPWSFPHEDVPADGALVRDLAERANGGFYRPESQAEIIALAGGGIDLYDLTADGCVVRGPAGCLAPLEGDQEYLILGWAKLPSAEDWNGGSVVSPIFTCSGANSYSSDTDLVTVAQSNTPRLYCSRQLSVGSQQSPSLGITDLAPYYGAVTQWAFWRTADECGMRMKSANGDETVTGAAGAVNSGSFATLSPQWGVPEAFNQHGQGTGSAPEHEAAGHRLYRGYIENLAASGRDPVAVLDEDWDFVTGLERYS